jgi:hypothetical protein
VKQPDPLEFVNGCLLVVMGSFLVLVFWVVCQDATRTRAQMEAAMKDAGQERVLAPVAATPATAATAGSNNPSSTTKCVTGQVHGPTSLPAPGDPLAPIN